MSDHEAELGERDPRSLLAEADYWRAVLEDLRAINDAVMAASSAVIDGQQATLPLIFMPAATEALEGSSAASKQALAAVGAIGERVEALASLAEGRLVMLRREGGLDQ